MNEKKITDLATLESELNNLLSEHKKLESEVEDYEVWLSQNRAEGFKETPKYHEDVKKLVEFAQKIKELQGEILKRKRTGEKK